MRRSYLLLSCLFADGAVSISRPAGSAWNLDGNDFGAELMRRASLSKPSESRKPRRTSVGFSASQNQASSEQASSSRASSSRATSDKPSSSKASSSKASSSKASSSQASSLQRQQSRASPGQIPSSQFYDIFLPLDRTSSGESDSNRSPSSPTKIDFPTSRPGSPIRSSRSPDSRDTSPAAPANRPKPRRSSDARYPFGIPTGPMRVPKWPQPQAVPDQQHQPVTQSTRERSPSPPPVPTPNIISGHPNSAMVAVRGPGWMQVQKSNGVSEVANVAPGKWDWIHQHDRQGLFAVGRALDGGYAVAATTGNAAAGYVAVGQGGKGYVETHDGHSFSTTDVEPGKEFRKHVRGDGTGSVKGAALATIEGHGQVTAVAMYREVAQPEL